MSQYTEHYNLKKPASSENYDIDVANTNNTIIDTILHTKVDKKADKDLSTNDFTNEYKKKIDSMQTLYRFKGIVNNVNDLSSINNCNIGDVYKCKEDMNNYVWNKTEWINIGQDSDLTNILNQLEQLRTEFYKGTNIVAETIEGTGKIHKLYGNAEGVGKNVNLFNKDTLQITNAWQCNYTKVGNDKINIKVTTVGGVAFIRTNTINLKAGTYTFSAKLEGNFSRIRILDSNEKEIASSDSNKSTFTLETDTVICLLFYVNNATISNYLNIENIQIEKGPEATLYREYGEGLIKVISEKEENTTFKTITCKPLYCIKNNIGNIIAQDYIDFDRQKIVRQCGYLTFDGSSDENWVADTRNNRFFIAKPVDCLRSENGNCTSICNKYGLNNTETVDESYNIGASIYVKDLSCTDLASFKQSLANNPMILIVALNTSYEEDIDCTCEIAQYEGETTIYNTEGAELEVELTNNKAMCSVNKSIANLQEKDIKREESKILWINNDTTKSISSQDSFQLNEDIKNFNYYEVLYLLGSSSDSMRERQLSSGKIKVGKVAYLQSFTNYTYWRILKTLSGKNLAFGDNSYFTTMGGSTTSIDNTRNIPYALIGYR